MKKKLLGYILAAAMLITAFIGCDDGNELADKKSEKIVLTGELAPVAEFYDVNLPFYDVNLEFVWCGKDFIYMEREWDKEAQINICTLYRVPADGSGEAIQIYQNTAEESCILKYTVDEEGNFYTLEWEPVGDTREFTLHKYDANMKEILCVKPDTEQVAVNELNAVQKIYLDNAAHIVMTDYENHAYFFDENLNFIWKESVPGEFWNVNFVDAGEQGSFFAAYDYMTCRVSLLKLDYENKRLEALPELNISDYLNEYDNLKIVSGKEYGILLSGEDALWKYNPDTGEVEQWFDWKDSNMNVYGTTVEEIKFYDETDNGPFMSVWCYDNGNSEMAEISYIDRAYLPEKQTVVIGTLAISDVSDWVSKFNRNSRVYKVVIKEYADDEELVQSFLFGQDEIPDILDISVTSSAMLENKGILEDLKPYFKASDVVKKEDILKPIWNMCENDGKITSMITNFYFQSMVTSADSISENGWTIDEFFSLQEQYPESKLLIYYNYWNVFRTLGDVSVEGFIDWEKKTCNFNSEEFIALIKRIKSLDYGDYEPVFYQEDEEIAALLSGDSLLKSDYYRTPYRYRQLQSKYKGHIKNVGFPTTNGEPYYRVCPDMQFSIYAGSKNKDGAWAFIEFMLSEDSQDWYGADCWRFPVRKVAFEEFIKKPNSPVINYVDDDMSIDTYSVFMNMIEHAHLSNRSSLGKISTIVSEELQAFFEGEKAAEEAAKIIQSRVKLYLDENY